MKTELFYGRLQHYRVIVLHQLTSRFLRSFAAICCRVSAFYCVLLTRGVCDSECLRLRQWMNEMRAEKPRAVIYYLVQKSTIHKLNISLHYLDANFNDRSVHSHRKTIRQCNRHSCIVSWRHTGP